MPVRGWHKPASSFSLYYDKPMLASKSTTYVFKSAWSTATIDLNVNARLYDGDNMSGINFVSADWPAIEARATEETWTFYRQVIVTVVAVLTIGWVVIRGRRR
ncbi:MAG: hypothetical protein ACI9G1_000980 [Pirellulaceae bacterium]|jgi:hypothetical protein